MAGKLVPKDFNPPEKVVAEELVLQKLTPEFLDADYQAVVGSRETIHRLRVGEWPQIGLTKEEDALDLAWHQREFEYKSSFAYAVTSRDGQEYLGCVYIYGPWEPWVKVPEGSDADINIWVTTEAYDQGLYTKLYRFIKEWIGATWPFRSPYFSNKEKPG